MGKSFKESYDSKLNDVTVFKSDVKEYLKTASDIRTNKDYIFLLSSVFEPIVLNGYTKVGKADSSSVCSWLDDYESEFNDVELSRELFQKIRSARNSIVHINISYKDDLQALKNYVYARPYPIFKQCMDYLLLDFKDLYDMKNIYVKLGGDIRTLPDELSLFG